MALKRILRGVLTLFFATAAFGVTALGAQQVRAVGMTPPRLSFVDGEVSYWRPGAEEWVPAQINTALAAGDSLYAGNGGNLELEIAARAYVRAGSGTTLGIDSLETGYLQLRVSSGHAAVDLRRLPDGQQIEVDTPNGAFLIDHIGYYRFDVDDQATRFAARRGGVARVVPAGGDEVEVGSSQQVVVSGTETATISRVAPASDDAWDRWNADRTAQLGEQPRSAQYVPPDVAGVDDLDRYGDWRETPKYGNLWVPRDVSADWVPYSTGRWVWDGYYGWTWVDDSPWGWAPYHYGRWCWNDGYWGWAPGPIAVQPVYAPALVAFFGGPHVGFSLSVGTPFVSWVALGWGEPVLPWWGPRGFVGRPYWGGWGGPRVVNNVVVNNTTIVNVHNINHYDNFRHRDAVLGIDSDRFGRGRVEPVRVDPDRVRKLRPVRGELGVRPVRESLVPRGSGRGAPPPDDVQNRRVVATRVPQDPARQPRAAGLVPSDLRRQPAPRLVSPRSERLGGRAAGVGRSVPPLRGGERGTVRERMRGMFEHPEGGNRSSRPERGGTVGESSNGGGRLPSAVDRNPGGRDGGRALGETRRAAPQPPVTNDRIPGERDRHGRERGAIEDRDASRAPAPPSVDQGRQPQRGHLLDGPIRLPPAAGELRGRGRARGGSRGSDVSVPAAPAREPGRSGRGEIQIPREPMIPPDRGGGAVPERGRSWNQQPQRVPNTAPRPMVPPRSFDGAGGGRGHSRIDQPQRVPQMPTVPPRRNEPAPSRESGRSFRQPSFQGESAPPPRQQEAPRGERSGSGSPPSAARRGAPSALDSGGGSGRRGAPL